MHANRDRTAEQDRRSQADDNARRARARARKARRDTDGGLDSAREGVLGGFSTPGAASRFEEDDNDEDDGSDDEGDESSDASDLDDEGKVLLLPSDLVDSEAQDDSVTFITPPSVNRPLSFAPVPSSILEEVSNNITTSHYHT
jgi:hypothetical protein